MTIRILELALIAWSGFSILRIALKRPFREDATRHPALAVGLIVLGLGVTGGAFLLVRHWPPALHVGGALAAIGLAVAWWRARPSYGAGRRWPPGSLGVGASLDAIGDRDFYRRQAEIHGPVFKMAQFHRPVACVLGLQRGRRILVDHTDALAGASLPYNRFVPKGSLRYMSATDHQAEAPLFREAITGLDLAPLEAAARADCRVELARFSEDSRRTPDGVPPGAYLDRWILRALSRAFFGLGADDPRFRTLDRIRHTLDLDSSGGPLWRRRMERAFADATGLLRAISADPSGPVGPAAPSGASVVGRLLARDPAALESEVRGRNLALVFRLAVGDLGALQDWILAKLSGAPDWQERVRTRPRGEAAPSPPADVASRIVFETLRMEQSEYLYRTVVRPFDLEGYTVPAGWLLRICVQESHRDPSIFSEPDRFDPDRFLGPTRSRREYSPFGVDGHGCMGVSMVHFYSRIFVEELCDGYSWTVTRDGPLDRGTRHRHHWKPHRARTLVLERRGPANP